MKQRADDCPRVSVIVPVFNTKPELLNACLSSLVNQSASPFEILLVDDGSQDCDCVSYLDEVGKNNPLVEVIHNNHEGVSAARNKGVACAQGDYVLFVDSDDRVPPHMIERGQQTIRDSGYCDVVMGYVQYVSPTDNPIEYSDPSLDPKFHSSDDMITYHLQGSNSTIRKQLSKEVILKVGPVAKLVKTRLARTVDFPVGVSISEDTLWSVSLFLNSDRVAVVEDIWYWYYKSAHSASSGVHATAAEDARRCLDALFEIAEKNQRRLSDVAVLTRVLGEVSRVAKAWYSQSDCKLGYVESVRELNELLESYPDSHIVSWLTAIKGGPVLALKYLMCRTGLIIMFWKIFQ